MVDEQLRVRGIKNESVLCVMSEVSRHEFVPVEYRSESYNDYPLPIGYDQTISQPYIVALMTSVLEPALSDSFLEIGTGSGYQTAVLSHLVAKVITFEWVPELAEIARNRFKRLGIKNVSVITGDGGLGSIEAPFDGIIVTAGAPKVPSPLFEQLAEGGRLGIPIGTRSHQVLTVIRRTSQGFQEEKHEGCVFVPLQGKFG